MEAVQTTESSAVEKFVPVPAATLKAPIKRQPTAAGKAMAEKKTTAEAEAAKESQAADTLVDTRRPGSRATVPHAALALRKAALSAVKAAALDEPPSIQNRSYSSRLAQLWRNRHSR